MRALDALTRLTACLSKLPGIGQRSAERLAFKLAQDRELAEELALTLKGTSGTIDSCRLCGGLTSRSENPCRLCTDSGRDGKVVCVVEDAGDIMAIERSGAFRGRYHVLKGNIGAADDKSQAGLRVDTLVSRVDKEGFDEVILALGTDVEGDAKAAYVREALRGVGVRISRIAFGLPAGSGIAYSDPVTLVRAIRGRTLESSDSRAEPLTERPL